MAEGDRLHLDLPGRVLHGNVAFVWKHRFPPFLYHKLCSTMAPKCASRVAQAQAHFPSHLAAHHRSTWRGSPLPPSEAIRKRMSNTSIPEKSLKAWQEAACPGSPFFALPCI